MLGWFVDRKIAPHIPVIDMAGRTDGTWSRADFELNAANNQYICPEGEALKQFRRNYSDPNRGPTGKGVAKCVFQEPTAPIASMIQHHIQKCATRNSLAKAGGAETSNIAARPAFAVESVMLLNH